VRRRNGEPDRAERKRQREFQKIIDKVNQANWKAGKPPVDSPNRNRED
jgi:hypothetical protein